MSKFSALNWRIHLLMLSLNKFIFMRKCFFILLSFVISNMFAQNADFKVVYLNPKTGIPAMFRFDANSSNVPNAENINAWMQNNLHTNAGFSIQFSKYTEGKKGSQHYKYQQYFGPYKVEGAELILNLQNKKTKSLYGKYFPQLTIDLNYSIQSAQALNIALSSFPNATFMWEIPQEENELKHIKGKKLASYYPHPELLLISTHDSCRSSDFRLAYKIDVYAYAPHSRQWIYVDANTGKIIKQEEQICTVDRMGIAHTKYSGIQNIMCDSVENDTFILFDHTRGNGIHTIDVRIIGLDSTREFSDTDNIWNNVNAAKDEIATDVHWGSEMTYDYYKIFHDRKSYDDGDGMIFSKVHVGKNYVNAFWNGVSANYGDGDSKNYSALTSIEICAHELTHGVTGNSASLIYRNESGALNESYSDILGKCVESFADSARFNWLIAGRITLKNKPFRDMSNPPNCSHPKYYNGKYYYTGTQDNGGVHYNSGVQNYWFYLLTQGGSGTRESDTMPFSVKGIGIEKAGQIAYQTLNTRLISESEYIDACYQSIDASIALYGDTSLETRMVKQAWYAVGLLNLLELDIEQDQSLSSAWTVYPNPATQNISIQNPSVFDASQVEIFDLTGQMLHSQTINPNESIDVSSFANGVYFVRINQMQTIKWIKQ